MKTNEVEDFDFDIENSDTKFQVEDFLLETLNSETLLNRTLHCAGSNKDHTEHYNVTVY